MALVTRTAPSSGSPANARRSPIAPTVRLRSGLSAIARSAAERKAAALRSKKRRLRVHAATVRAVDADGSVGGASHTHDRVGERVEAEEHFETMPDRQVRPRGRVGRLTLHERLIRIAQAAVFFAGEMLDELGELHEQP